MTEGARAHDTRGQSGYGYAPPDMGFDGGGTYTNQDYQNFLNNQENIFGPSGRDVKNDPQRDKRLQRLHIPEITEDQKRFLQDRIDGLISDATNSPFTSKILPYKYMPYPDGKIKWNVYSFDEGLASRVPYESAARVLTQSKRAFAGYLVRQGMAIVMEHNFMMTERGRNNFKNQLQQLIGSIQYTNDLDVHVALISAPSYQQHMREKFFVDEKTPAQTLREYIDLFGFMQKNVNGLDILIEEGKAHLKNWGGPVPDFLLCNSKLTFQLTMTPEKTSYVTQGYDGIKRLRAGPDLPSYRGINIIHSRSFSMEHGVPPRDVLRRRVRVAEYYRIYPSKENKNRMFQLYNEERDMWFTLSFKDLLDMAANEHNVNHLRSVRRRLFTEYISSSKPMQLGVDVSLLNDGSFNSDEVSREMKDLFEENEDKKIKSEFFNTQSKLNTIINVNSKNMKPSIELLKSSGRGLIEKFKEYERIFSENKMESFKSAVTKEIKQVRKSYNDALKEYELHRESFIQMIKLYNAELMKEKFNDKLNFFSKFAGNLQSKTRKKTVDCLFTKSQIQSFMKRCHVLPLLTTFYESCSNYITDMTNIQKLQTEQIEKISSASKLEEVPSDPIITQEVADEMKAKGDRIIQSYTAFETVAIPVQTPPEKKNQEGDRRGEEEGEREGDEDPEADEKVEEEVSVKDDDDKSHDEGDGGGGAHLGGGGHGGSSGGGSSKTINSDNIEIVIIRPNIEHYMLGMIMGKAGEELGNTLWGQTELSCYDDSMHGVWGMSYKYHERAMVFNEKNLMRYWDIAYDGYCGGKNDTHVDWTNRDKVNEFKELSMDISKTYTGPSMMVMAFKHDEKKLPKRNWPSPILFNDECRQEAKTVPVDSENLQKINTDNFRVFNEEIYKQQYKTYKDNMPNFNTNHQSRKSAGQSATENETSTDSLAFQGSMRILNQDGKLIEEILGSGHHGPDYVGIASQRSGKGLKINTQPSLSRII